MTNDEFIALTTEAGFEEGWVEVCKVRAELTRLIELATAKEREATLVAIRSAIQSARYHQSDARLRDFSDRVLLDLLDEISTRSK